MWEDKVVEVLVDQNHFYLMLGIFCFLYFIRLVQPIANFLFVSKWKWLVPILNLGLSAAGIFLLGMTSAVTIGMKFVVMFLITTVTSYGYELTKPLVKKVLEKILGKEAVEEFFKKVPEITEKTPS